MARKLRLEFPGACYHVVNRGNYRRDLFIRTDAATCFERCLAQASERFHWRVHAFVIMRNHFHLALETPEPNLSDGMKWLQGTWAARVNRFRGEQGRPFQGRYYAQHVEPGHALAQVCHYIHLNPVRAGVLPAAQLPVYRWSSLRRFMSPAPRPAWLVPATVLLASGDLPDHPEGWRRYCDYLGVLAETDPKHHNEKTARLFGGWAIGSREFLDMLREELLARALPAGSAPELLGADRNMHRGMRAQIWEERLVALARAMNIPLAALPPRYSALPKVRLAAAMKRTTSASNVWLAARLNMGNPASLAPMLRRFRAAQAARNPQVESEMPREST